MSRCTATLGSVTYANKARAALSAGAINSFIVKAGGAKIKKGCSYGIEIDCNQVNNAEIILRSAGIKYDRFIPAENHEH